MADIAYLSQWPEYVFKHFTLSKPTATEEFSSYGPWNTALGVMFPPALGFVITPQYRRPEGSSITDFTTLFLVSNSIRSADMPTLDNRDEASAVLVVEVKPPAARRSNYAHRKADEQMRDRLDEMRPLAKIARVSGISAFGPFIRTYEMHVKRGKIVPAAITKYDPDRVTNLVPKQLWNLNVLSQEGFNKMKEIAVYIRGALDRQRSATHRMVTRSKLPPRPPAQILTIGNNTYNVDQMSDSGDEVDASIEDEDD